MIYLIYIPFAWLWWLGGGKHAWTRDILIPILAGVVMFIKFHDPYLAVLTIGSFQIIRLGYGAYDPINDSKPSFLASITKDKLGAINRGLYGFIVGIVGLLPFAIFTGNYLHQIIYALILSLTGYLVVKLKSNRLVTDLNIGASAGNVIII